MFESCLRNYKERFGVLFFLYRYVRLYFIVMQQKKEGVDFRLLLFSYAQTFISRLISYIC